MGYMYHADRMVGAFRPLPNGSVDVNCYLHHGSNRNTGFLSTEAQSSGNASGFECTGAELQTANDPLDVNSLLLDRSAKSIRGENHGLGSCRVR